MEEGGVVVIDPGSGTFRAGVAGDDEPKVVIPSLVARDRHRGILTQVDDTRYIGQHAPGFLNDKDISYPIEHGVITNIDDFENILEYSLNFLKFKENEHSILFTEPLFSPKSQRELMAEIVFEKFNATSYVIQNQTVLDLYASGRVTGMVVDIGEGSLCVLHVLCALCALCDDF
jgi:actin-related protein